MSNTISNLLNNPGTSGQFCTTEKKEKRKKTCDDQTLREPRYPMHSFHYACSYKYLLHSLSHHSSRNGCCVIVISREGFPSSSGPAAGSQQLPKIDREQEGDINYGKCYLKWGSGADIGRCIVRRKTNGRGKDSK